MPLPLLPTALVGSYAQPEWLIDRAKLAGRFPPRVRAKELWRVEPALLAEAQDDATVLAAIERFAGAGLDGVEVFYPTHDERQTRLLHETCTASGTRSCRTVRRPASTSSTTWVSAVRRCSGVSALLV